MKEKPTICIIDGVARSGTTFFGAVLNTLPGVYSFTDTFKLPQYYQEMHGILDFPFSLSAYRKPSNVDYGKLIPSFESFEYCIHETLTLLKDPSLEQKIENRIREKVLLESTLSYVKIFNIFFESVSEELGVSIVGGKTTFCHNYRDQMLLTIPNLKWIDIIRDVRGVMSSGLGSNMYDFNKLFLHEPWQEHAHSLMNKGETAAHDIHKRHLVIIYRDLILNKRETILKIAEFLEIKDFDYEKWEKQPVLKNDKSEFGSHSSFDEYGKPKGNKDFMTGFKAFDSKPVERWKAHLSKSQKWLLQRLYKKELTFFNFEVNPQYGFIKPQYVWLHMKISFGRLLRLMVKIIKKYF
jgi:hypothetical protein